MDGWMDARICFSLVVDHSIVLSTASLAYRCVCWSPGGVVDIANTEFGDLPPDLQVRVDTQVGV